MNRAWTSLSQWQTFNTAPSPEARNPRSSSAGLHPSWIFLSEAAAVVAEKARFRNINACAGDDNEFIKFLSDVQRYAMHSLGKAECLACNVEELNFTADRCRGVALIWQPSQHGGDFGHDRTCQHGRVYWHGAASFPRTYTWLFCRGQPHVTFTKVQALLPIQYHQ